MATYNVSFVFDQAKSHITLALGILANRNQILVFTESHHRYKNKSTSFL